MWPGEWKGWLLINGGGIAIFLVAGAIVVTVIGTCGAP